MTTEEYRNYKILFERCLIVPITKEVSTLEENENPKKEPEDEV